MEIKLFVASEIQYFELGIFSFNLFIYYQTRGFIAWTGAFNSPTCAFNLATRAFSLLTREFELITRVFQLITREFELVTREFELVTCGFQLVTRVLYFSTFLSGTKSAWAILSYSSGPILEGKGMRAIFSEKGQKSAKKIENLGKNVQNLKIFWKRATLCERISHAWNS